MTTIRDLFDCLSLKFCCVACVLHLIFSIPFSTLSSVYKSLGRPVSHIRDIAEKLSIHGYPEANDDELFIQRGNILERLLSFKLNTAVGYKLESAWQVINSVLQEKSPYSIEWWSLYLIGINVWKPTLNEHQAERVSRWRAEVKRSINAGENEYQRNDKYDRLLTLLFPDLVKALSWKPTARPLPEPDLFLRGKTYENWKKSYPESAKQWEERPSKK